MLARLLFTPATLLLVELLGLVALVAAAFVVHLALGLAAAGLALLVAAALLEAFAQRVAGRRPER
jgi:hypothetical protein